MIQYPLELLKLQAYLKKLPGVGSKTAERFAFGLLSWKESDLQDFAQTLHLLKENIRHCPECGCLMAKEGCHFCDKYKRDASVICVISSAKDAFSIEETHSYKGLYHVIGGLLSPLDGRHPDHLLLDPLIKRIETLHIKEMIIALDSTIEGDATALFLKQQLSAKNLQISRLAFGLPMGSSLDFVDGGTLTRALTGRQTF